MEKNNTNQLEEQNSKVSNQWLTPLTHLQFFFLFFSETNNPGQQTWQFQPYFWPFDQLKIQVMFWTEHLSCFPHFPSTAHRQRLTGKFRDQTNTHRFCVRWCLSCSAKLILCLKGIIYVTSKYAAPLMELKYVASCKQKKQKTVNVSQSMHTCTTDCHSNRCYLDVVIIKEASLYFLL